MGGVGAAALLSAKPGPLWDTPGNLPEPSLRPSVHHPPHTGPTLLPLTTTERCKQDESAWQQLVERTMRSSALWLWSSFLPGRHSLREATGQMQNHHHTDQCLDSCSPCLSWQWTGHTFSISLCLQGLRAPSHSQVKQPGSC